MNKLPKLTKKQLEIIKLLYKYRFINRIQIQKLMNHKDPKTINMWLRDLREKEYIGWIYSTHFAEKTKPAVYYIKLNAIRYLRQLSYTNQDGKEYPAYPPEELRKRYREPSRSQSFIDHCILIADTCTFLSSQNHDNENLSYYCQTEADYIPKDSYYNFILASELIRPSLIFCKNKYNPKDSTEQTLESYILEVLDPTLPRYRMKKRLENYITFLEQEGYKWQRKTNTQKLPILLIVCPKLRDLIYAKRKTRGLIANIWYWKNDKEKRPTIKFITIDNLKQGSVLNEELWEKA